VALTSYLNLANKALYVSAWGAPQIHAAKATLIGVGTAAADTLYDDGLKATLTGGAGDDTYFVTTTSTKIVELAGGGNDTVVTYFDFKLPDFVENLTIGGVLTTASGNALDNLITITGTRNTAIGGAGNDVFINNGGANQRFAFTNGDGKDVIIGFHTGAVHDYVQLTGYNFTDYASVAAKMTQVGSDVLLTTSSTDAILFKNHVISDFSAADFGLAVDTSKLTLTFNESFDSLSLWSATNPTGVWKTNYISGVQSGSNSLDSRTLGVNGEQQVYVDPTVTGSGSTALGINPFSVSNGILTIEADKVDSATQSKLWGYQYTSGLLTTEKSFSQLYGYFEMRADIPTGQGVWPAFWLLPTDMHSTTELDVMENFNGSDAVLTTSHSAETGSAVSSAFSTLVQNLASGYHTYGVLWTAETITWSIDGVAVASMATPADMHTAMYMLVNLAVGGNFGGAAAADLASAQLKVDYIKAYSLTSTTAQTAVAAGNSAASNSAASASDGVTYYTTYGVSDVAPANYDAVRSAYDHTMNATTHTLVLTGAKALTGVGNGLDNVITANDGGDTLYGLGGNDTLTGGAGADYLDGGTGADTLIGGAGNDTYVVDNVGDVVVEAANGGVDTVRAAIDYSLGANVENLILTGAIALTGTGNDLDNVLTANNGGDHLYGGAGADTLIGGMGADYLDGGLGADKMAGGAGNDLYIVDNIGDTVIELSGEGVDTVMSSVNFTLGANIENLTLTGTAALLQAKGNALDNIIIANDAGAQMWGMDGNDTLIGGAGNDWMNGGAGADIMKGGLGNDSYVVDNVNDVVVELAGQGVDTITTTVSYTLSANVERMVLSGTAAIDGTGNELANTLTGNDAANILRGLDGNDIISGGGGNDLLDGGLGQDILTGGAGADTFLFATLADSTVAKPDLITDLQNIDFIDLRQIDANSLVAGDQAFNIVSAFGHKAGELQLTYDAAANHTVALLDVNGDGKADAAIWMTGNHMDFQGWLL
jgi:Ca2+-binding RTX toxin-like protein